MIPDKAPLFSFEHTLRSRYSETDKMGYVYYGRYLEYFEVARTEMIRSMGISYRQLEDKGIMLPVVESHIKYKAPLFYDDQILIKVFIVNTPAVKLETYYKMFTDRSEKLHATGKVVLCFMKEENRKPCYAPELFMKRWSKIVKSEQ